VDHDILILKMENYGAIGKGKELFQSCLKGRYQQVITDNKTNHNTTVSNWARIKHGLPQVSVLDPAHFLLYKNALPAVINIKAIPVLFADGTSIIFTHHNFVEFDEDIETVFGNVNT